MVAITTNFSNTEKKEGKERDDGVGGKWSTGNAYNP